MPYDTGLGSVLSVEEHRQAYVACLAEIDGVGARVAHLRELAEYHRLAALTTYDPQPDPEPIPILEAAE